MMCYNGYWNIAKLVEKKLFLLFISIQLILLVKREWKIYYCSIKHMHDLIAKLEEARLIALELVRDYEVHRIDEILMDLYHNEES